MAKIKIVTVDDAPTVQTPLEPRGQIETRAFHNEARDPLHLYLHRLSPGATLRVESGSTDHLAHVWRGAVEAGGARLGAGSSLIVEFGAAMEVTAGDEGASLLLFSERERRADARPGGHVHLLPNERVPRSNDLKTQNRIGGGIHADAHCPTCELWLHENDFYTPHSLTAVHSHSEDEIIFVTKGAMLLGKRSFGPGTAVAIPANTKYGFHVGPDGLSFINFRAASPTVTSGDGKIVMDEAEFWRSRIGKPEYLQTG